jgi:hypothetical protein
MDSSRVSALGAEPEAHEKVPLEKFLWKSFLWKSSDGKSSSRGELTLGRSSI